MGDERRATFLDEMIAAILRHLRRGSEHVRHWRRGREPVTMGEVRRST
jgi:hypothetical protein